MLQYPVHVENASLYNTPPVFTIYVMRLVLAWLVKQGGLAAIEQVNERKAGKLYAEIDRTGFYRGHAKPDSRSRMNVTFRLPSEELEKTFAKDSTSWLLVRSMARCALTAWMTSSAMNCVAS